jgi:hypothetical protein
MMVDKVSVGTILFKILRFYPVNIISPNIRVPSFITNAVSSYQLEASSNKTLKNKLGLISQSMAYFYLLTDFGVFVCNVT